MNKTLELPLDLYDALQAAAQASGTTPQGWIAKHLGHVRNGEHGDNARTMADLFKGKIGLFDSEAQEKLSENCGARFADYLEQKHREGRL